MPSVPLPPSVPVPPPEEPLKLVSSNSIKHDFAESIWKKLPEENLKRCRARLELFRRELASEDSQVMGQTFQSVTERLFACIAWGVEELMLDKSEVQMNEGELKIRQFKEQDQFSFIRKFSIALQKMLQERYVSMDKNHPSGYPSRSSILLKNLQDESNPELRRSILAGTKTCEQLVKAREEELWTAEKRLQLEKVEKKFYDSRTIQLNTFEPPEESQIDYATPVLKTDRKKVESCEEIDLEKKLAKTKENLKRQLEDMPVEWEKKLSDDLPPKIAEELKKNLRKTLESEVRSLEVPARQERDSSLP